MTDETQVETPQEPQVEEQQYTVDEKLDLLAANVLALIEISTKLVSRVDDIEAYLSGFQEEELTEEVTPDGTSH